LPWKASEEPVKSAKKKLESKKSRMINPLQLPDGTIRVMVVLMRKMTTTPEWKKIFDYNVKNSYVFFFSLLVSIKFG